MHGGLGTRSGRELGKTGQALRRQTIANRSFHGPHLECSIRRARNGKRSEPFGIEVQAVTWSRKRLEPQAKEYRLKKAFEGGFLLVGVVSAKRAQGRRWRRTGRCQRT